MRIRTQNTRPEPLNDLRAAEEEIIRKCSEMSISASHLTGDYKTVWIALARLNQLIFLNRNPSIGSTNLDESSPFVKDDCTINGVRTLDCPCTAGFQMKNLDRKDSRHFDIKERSSQRITEISFQHSNIQAVRKLLFACGFDGRQRLR